MATETPETLATWAVKTSDSATQLVADLDVMKTCSKCGEVKASDEFPKIGARCQRCKNEYLREWARRPKVAERIRERRNRPEEKERLKRFQQSPEYMARRRELSRTPEMKAKRADYNRRTNNATQKRSVEKRRFDPITRANAIVGCRHYQAIRRGIPANREDMLQVVLSAIRRGTCEVSGIPFTHANGKISATSLTLDRVTPERGYVAGNMRCVLHAVNMGMSDWGLDVTLRIWDAVKTHQNRYEG